MHAPFDTAGAAGCRDPEDLAGPDPRLGAAPTVNPGDDDEDDEDDDKGGGGGGNIDPDEDEGYDDDEDEEEDDEDPLWAGCPACVLRRNMATISVRLPSRPRHTVRPM